MIFTIDFDIPKQQVTLGRTSHIVEEVKIDEEKVAYIAKGEVLDKAAEAMENIIHLKKTEKHDSFNYRGQLIVFDGRKASAINNLLDIIDVSSDVDSSKIRELKELLFNNIP